MGKGKGGIAGFGVGSHLSNNKNLGELNVNTDDALDTSVQHNNLLSTPSSKNDDNDLLHGGSDQE